MANSCNSKLVIHVRITLFAVSSYYYVWFAQNYLAYVMQRASHNLFSSKFTDLTVYFLR
jgi:hypothetical protein